MKTITIEIKDGHALKTIKTLEEKQYISIIETSEVDSPALSGKPLSQSEFNNWIRESELSPTVALSDVKEKWAVSILRAGNKRKKVAKNYLK